MNLLSPHSDVTSIFPVIKCGHTCQACGKHLINISCLGSSDGSVACSGGDFWIGEESILDTPTCLSSQDAKFVEERRKQLQDYLRNVMNKVIQMVPEFASSPKKETLVQLMPFFV